MQYSKLSYQLLLPSGSNCQKMEIKLWNLIWEGKWSHWHQYFLFGSNLASSFTEHLPISTSSTFLYILSSLTYLWLCHLSYSITFPRGNLMRQSWTLWNLRSEWHRWQQHSNGSSSSSAREVAAPPALSIISEVALDPHSWFLWHHRAGK